MARRKLLTIPTHVLTAAMQPKKPSDVPQGLIGMIADEVAKTVIQRLPSLLPSPRSRRKKAAKKAKLIENGIFLDTSAIIDGRVFELINLHVFSAVFVVPESILLELKHIADSQDTVRRERGQRGLTDLEKLRKVRDIKFMVLPEEEPKEKKKIEVDEKLIAIAKHHKGRIITCDYNLEKKANIDGVKAININGLANVLKVTAVPGEALHIKVLHHGKDASQGVGYLDDGTMIVVEDGKEQIGKTIDVVVARVIQTATGRILFAKKI